MIREPLTYDQQQLVLETVASHAEILQRLVGLTNMHQDDAFTVGAVRDAIHIVASAIGALADGATGAGVVGTLPDWFCGPNFAAAGKEVSHG